jgi:hypothetical protein
MDRLSQNIEKIRELQELQVADQWFNRYWSAYEAREESAKAHQKRELYRKNAPCFYVKPDKAARYWYDVFVEMQGPKTDYDTFREDINLTFNEGCICSTCLHLHNPGFFDYVKLAFDVPVERNYIRRRGGPIKLSQTLSDPFVQEILNNYSSLQGDGICPHCNKRFNLVVPDTQNLAKFIYCTECKTPINSEEAIKLCFS